MHEHRFAEFSENGLKIRRCASCLQPEKKGQPKDTEGSVPKPEPVGVEGPAFTPLDEPVPSEPAVEEPKARRRRAGKES